MATTRGSSVEHKWASKASALFKKYQPPAGAIGMTTREELCLAETFAREGFTGAGKIVDLGCWLGATTLSLAKGLQDNRRARDWRRIEAFDLFIWENWMNPIADYVKYKVPFQEGENFLETVRQLCAPYGDSVKLLAEDLMKYRPAPEPIEFLFVDAMKSWVLAETIVTNFFPHLLPGKAYVVQQDYAWYGSEMATNHLIMWHLRENFEWVMHVTGGCSVLFWYKKPFATEKLPVYKASFFTPDMVEEAYEYSVFCVDEHARPYLYWAKLNFLIEQGHAVAAQKQLERIRRESILARADILERVRQLISARRHHERKPDWLEELEAALPGAPAPGRKKRSLWGLLTD